MKKTFLSVMIAAVSMFTFTAMAQDNKCDNNQCKKEACGKQCGHEMKKDCPNPFEGLNLTQEQKDKLGALQAPCKKDKADKQKQRQQRDSLARAARAQHLADIKAILTPEQYVQFLENLALQAPQKDMKQGRGPRHDRRGGKMGKPCPLAPGQGQCPQESK